MNRKTLYLPGFEFAMFLGIASLLLSGTAMGAITDAESRILLERILEAHKTQSAALANYEFRAQWEETGSGVGGSSSKTSGAIHRVHQGDQCYFTFASTHDNRGTPMGDGHYEFETRGLLNDGYFATWSIDHSAGKYLSLKWFELPSDGSFPDTSRVFNYGLTRIRPLERAMGPGGDGLQALVDNFPEEKILITCREESTAGGQRIRVTVELPDHGIPGPWSRVLLNPAKGYMVEESIVMGPDGTELTSKFKLSEVSDGVWFPKEIVMNTTASNENSHIRSERFQLLDFKLAGCYPEASFTLPALNTPPKLLKTYGVSRYYLDGRVEVTTIDGNEHLGRVKRASFSRE